MASDTESFYAGSDDDRTRELSVAAAADTLLNAWIRQALRDITTHLHGRTKPSQVLHPYATRAVFAGTLGRLTETQLLELLYPRDRPDGGMDAHDFAKSLRRPSGARGAKIDILRSHFVQLLRSGSVDVAEVAKGFCFALVHLAALRVVHGARPSQLDAVRNEAQPLSELLMDGWVAQVLDELDAIKSSELARAARATERRMDGATEMALLAGAALKVLTLISRYHPLEGLGILLRELSLELNELALATAQRPRVSST